jgi:hypothetical protein
MTSVAVAIILAAMPVDVTCFGDWNKRHKRQSGSERCNRADSFSHLVSLIIACVMLPARARVALGSAALSILTFLKTPARRRVATAPAAHPPLSRKQRS